jgi:hypothetical protein
LIKIFETAFRVAHCRCQENTHRIPLERMQDWDYGTNAVYFATICMKNRVVYEGSGGYRIAFQVIFGFADFFLGH